MKILYNSKCIGNIIKIPKKTLSVNKMGFGLAYTWYQNKFKQIAKLGLQKSLTNLPNETVNKKNVKNFWDAHNGLVFGDVSLWNYREHKWEKRDIINETCERPKRQEELYFRMNHENEFEPH